MVRIITVEIIRNGANYISHHLRKNDYSAEGEKAVQGEWIGEGAKALGLSGEVAEAFAFTDRRGLSAKPKTTTRCLLAQRSTTSAIGKSASGRWS